MTPKMTTNLTQPPKNSQSLTVLIMAAGTGGHIFPALAVADELTQRGAVVHWLGTPMGMENTLVGERYPMHHIAMQGVRGKGVGRLFALPTMLLKALGTAKAIIQQNQIDVVVGFGGYVSVPGGLAAKLMGKPLIIHEQNATAGLANRILARFAQVILQGFSGAFGANTAKMLTVGNPVRKVICDLPPPNVRDGFDINPAITDKDKSDSDWQKKGLKLLVLGGSLGADAINQAVLSLLPIAPMPLTVKHQCGKSHYDKLKADYAKISLDSKHKVDVLAFIDDMAAVYQWADVVLCRAGALTVSEIACVGVPAILVPLPSAVDDHQTANAKSLTNNNAGILLPQDELTGERLAQILSNLDPQQRKILASNAYACANKNSTRVIAEVVADMIECKAD